MRKSVVLIGPAYPLRGGIAAFIERIARAYIEKGDDVQIESFKLQYPSFLFPGKTQYSEDKPPVGLEITTSINSMNPFNWLKIGRKIKKQKPDLVVLKFWIPYMAPCLGTIARIIKRNKHTKIICIVDNIIPHEKRPMDRLLASYFVRSMHGLIAMSHVVMNQLIQLNDRIPSLFSPHPVYDQFGESIERNIALQKLKLSPDYQYMLFFGIIRDYKGLDILLEAMADEKVQSIDNLKLIVAGEFYSNRDSYLKIIEKNKLSDKLVLADGFIKDEDVASYFSAADVIVQPYKSATQSGVTQIAYHFEKPMIVTNVGGLPEIVPHHKAGYVTEVSVDAIAHAIHDFYTSDRRNSFAGHIKEEKKKYAWDYLLSSIETLMFLNIETQEGEIKS